jgi:hypothetical protein
MRSDGFSIALPTNWLPLATDEASLKASLEDVAKKSPKLAEGIQSQAKALTSGGAKLIAFDLTAQNSTSGFTTLVNVIKQSSDKPIVLDNYISSSIAALEQAKGVAKPIIHRRTTLPAGEAEELRYKVSTQKADASPLTLSYIQHAIVKDKTVFVITYACAADQSEKYPDIFNKIAQSFKVIQ